MREEEQVQSQVEKVAMGRGRELLGCSLPCGPYSLSFDIYDCNNIQPCNESTGCVWRCRTRHNPPWGTFSKLF